MTIQSKDGFEFYTNANGEIDSFILKGDNLVNEIEYIKKNKLLGISLSYFKSNKVRNLDFLSEIDFVQRVSITDMDIDYSGLYYLKDLKYAILGVKGKKQHLDFSNFPNLEYLSVDWYAKFPDLSNCKRLKEVVLWKYKPKSQSFRELKLPSSLECLEVSDANICDFNDFNLVNLRSLEGHNCKNLFSLDGLRNVSSNLNILVLDNCKKLTDYKELECCQQLEKIIIGDCGDIPHLKWIRDLKKVKHFSFWGTSVIDGDISPCIGIEYVSFKNSKKYNYKMEDFIHIRPDMEP